MYMIHKNAIYEWKISKYEIKQLLKKYKMCIRDRVTGIELAKCLVKEYLSVTFDPESRSMPKVARITEYEKEGK